MITNNNSNNDNGDNANIDIDFKSQEKTEMKKEIAVYTETSQNSVIKKKRSEEAFLYFHFFT